MRAPDVLQLAVRVQLLTAELADRLQHGEARRILRPNPAHETVIHQRGDDADDVALGVARVRHDGLRGVEREPADENGQEPKYPTRLGVQEVVGPGYRVAHGPLPRRQVPRTVIQPPQAIS